MKVMSNATIETNNVVNEVTRVLRMEGQAILRCTDKLESAGPDGESAREAIRKALTLMQKALTSGGKIVVTGVGKSGKVGQKIAATLCSTGSLAIFLHPTEGLHGDLGVLRANDVVLLFSYTGNTEELVKLQPSIRAMSVPVIGIGGNSQSKLGQQCDVWIDGFVEQEACPHNLAPTSSTTLALAIGDALAMALMQLRGFDADAFASNHPGGSLGRRLSLRVSDVMQKGDAVPTVARSASMDEVVVAATKRPLGGVLVVEGPKLLGFITEGDIRRALKHREKFFELKAHEVMTVSPITVAPESMAKAALELMENRPKPINLLPVIDEQGNWRGIVRVHDLISSF
jgi:arabinose-5-phosphate isomerase